MRFELETRARILNYLYTRNEMLAMIVRGLKDNPAALALDLPIPLPTDEEKKHNSPERINYLNIVATRYPRFARQFPGLPDADEVLEESVRLYQLPKEDLPKGARRYVDNALKRTQTRTTH